MADSTWRTTALGVKLMFGSTAALMAANVLARFLQLFAFTSLDAIVATFSTSFVTNVISGAVMVIGTITFYIGLGTCCTVPDPTARRWAITHFVTAGLTVVTAILFLAMLGSFLGSRIRSSNDPVELWFAATGSGRNVVIAALALLAFVLVAYGALMLFYVAIADALGDRSLRRLALLNLAAGPAFAVLNVAFWLFVREMPGLSASDKILIPACAGLLMTVVHYSLYLTLMRRTVARIES